MQNRPMRAHDARCSKFGKIKTINTGLLGWFSHRNSYPWGPKFIWLDPMFQVCVCILLKQTGSIRSAVNAWNAGGQSSLMLLCPTKLRIREGSIHWPWMCTCKHVLTMFFCVNESCDHSFTLLLVSIMGYDLFVMYGNWAKPQTQRAESCSFRTL